MVKTWKASGPDNMPQEALKADLNTATEILHSLFKKIWEKEKLPDDRKEGLIIKLPKKGDLRD